MPHIIVEYSEQISQQIAIKSILQNIHESVANSGIFKASQIKTRAYAFTDFTHARTTEPYIHIYP